MANTIHRGQFLALMALLEKMENDPKDLSCHLDELEKNRIVRPKQFEGRNGAERAEGRGPPRLREASARRFPGPREMRFSPRGLGAPVLPRGGGLFPWPSPCSAPRLCPTQLPSHPYGNGFLSLFSASALRPTLEDLAHSKALRVPVFYVRV